MADTGKRDFSEISHLFFSGREIEGPRPLKTRIESTARPDLQEIICRPTASSRADLSLELFHFLAKGKGSKALQSMEGSNHGMALIDGDGKIRGLNEQAEQMLGIDRQAGSQTFPYSLQPNESMLITISRADRTSGIGRLQVSAIEWQDETAYLVTITEISRGG